MAPRYLFIFDDCEQIFVYGYTHYTYSFTEVVVKCSCLKVTDLIILSTFIRWFSGLSILAL